MMRKGFSRLAGTMADLLVLVLMVILAVLLSPVLLLYGLFCLYDRIRYRACGSGLRYTVGITSTTSFRIERALRKSGRSYRLLCPSGPEGRDCFLLDNGIALIDGRKENEYLMDPNGDLFWEEPEWDRNIGNCARGTDTDADTKPRNLPMRLSVAELIARNRPDPQAPAYVCYQTSQQAKKYIHNALCAHPAAIALPDLPKWLKEVQDE